MKLLVYFLHRAQLHDDLHERDFAPAVVGERAAGLSDGAAAAGDAGGGGDRKQDRPVFPEQGDVGRFCGAVRPLRPNRSTSKPKEKRKNKIQIPLIFLNQKKSFCLKVWIKFSSCLSMGVRNVISRDYFFSC